MNFMTNSSSTNMLIESLGNPSKDRQRFVDGIVLIVTPYWPKRLSNFENLFETPFEFGLQMSNNARFCQTVSFKQLSRLKPS